MLKLDTYLEEYFGATEIVKALLFEEELSLDLYLLVEEQKDAKALEASLGQTLGLNLRIFTRRDGTIPGLLKDFKLERGGLPEDLDYKLVDGSLELISSDTDWLNSKLKELEDFFWPWQEIKLIGVASKIEEEDFREALKDELNQLVKDNAVIKETKEKKKKTHKYLQKVRGPFVKIADIIEEEQGQNLSIAGELISIDKRDLKNGKVLVTLSIYDGTNSMGCKFFTSKKDEEVLDGIINKGDFYSLQGSLKYDSYNNELMLFPSRINQIERPPEKMDRAERKRVELHLHTTMSEIDGVSDIADYLARAKAWGHKALAITDLASFHSFPKAFEKAKKSDIKVLYGLEILEYDDEKPVVEIENYGFHDTFIALDLETTGLRNDRDEIIEIGAVKIQNFQIVDSYHSFVKPDKNIPYHITELTGITNEMVSGARELKEVFGEFLSFTEDYPIVGHNLDFDRGFLQVAAKKLGYDFNPQGVDTLALSRLVLRDIKRHRLNQVAKKLKIPQLDHHRALDDALVCGKIFVELLRILENQDVRDFDGVNSLADQYYYISASRKYTTSLLAKNTQSLKKLYEMASISNLNYLEHGQPLVPSSLLKQYREHFLVGSSGSDGWLVDNIIMCTPEEELKDYMKKYDFVELQPLGQYSRYFERNTLNSLDELKEVHMKIIELADGAGLPLVATGDVRYLDKEDFLYRNIVRAGQKKNLSLEVSGNHYFRTTEEMMEEFVHLGDRAEEIVIDNTIKIADSIEEIIPIPQGKFPPEIEGSDLELKNKCYSRAEARYGSPLPELIKARLDYELNAIIKNKFSVLYIVAEKLVKKSNDAGYLVGSRGSVGSSFAATMAGITEVNPLPPHYYCKNCKYSEFADEAIYDNGYDMKNKDCPVCGSLLKKDGFNIPFESFMGFEGNKEPDIDLNFAPNIQGEIHKYTEELFGRDNVFKAGTIGTVADRTAFGYVINYFEERDMEISRREIERIIGRVTGVRRSSGQHPGGIIVLPKDQSIYNFTPIQYPANDPTSGVITTHFDYKALEGKLLKLDILGHDVPSIIHDLEEMTGFDSSQVRFDDEGVLSIFNSVERLELKDSRYKISKGTLGIPEFGTGFVRNMLEDTKPENLSDLIRISGLSHGTNVWLNNAQDLVRNGVITIKDVIATREQIMVYGVQMGIPRDHAFNIMERVRKGRGLSEEDLAVMKEVEVPAWYLDSCNKISYMFPKAHAVAYVLMSFRIAYYKVHFPLAFYASYFSTKVDDFDAKAMTQGIDKVVSYLENHIPETGASKKEEDYYALMEVVYEMYARGLEFKPVDLYKSHAWKFLIEDGKILPPLRSISGLGHSAALAIVEAREQPFISVEDLQTRAKVNVTAAEALRSLGCFEDMPESNQISIFDYII
ncbi:MAG: PolC-type DNA polymerase III [Tissierellia bacterium]|nr:PolC-type DNA polymerase III [Tissierellia bacterium]